MSGNDLAGGTFDDLARIFAESDPALYPNRYCGPSLLVRSTAEIVNLAENFFRPCLRGLGLVGRPRGTKRSLFAWRLEITDYEVGPVYRTGSSHGLPS